jgi:hypothetical protein
MYLLLDTQVACDLVYIACIAFIRPNQYERNRESVVCSQQLDGPQQIDVIFMRPKLRRVKNVGHG